MILPMLPPTRFCPTTETLAVLNDRRWILSYSGGKDSTSLVTWIEWLRRIGMVKCQTPALVMSDTTVEYPFLRGIADRVMVCLQGSGWTCEVVTPRVEEKLYCRIFGRGNTPVHPGGRKMRWCSRSTKIDPMRRYARGIVDDVVQLSGVRWGESDVRDGKLAAGGCAAGGECGLPEPGEGVFGPIITWKVCKVIEWLQGEAGEEINATIHDLLPMMRELVKVYDVSRVNDSLFGAPPTVKTLRFGCIGCPAITRSRVIAGHEGRKHPQWIVLRRLWAMWQEMYLRKNRCCRIYDEGKPSLRRLQKSGPKPTWSPPRRLRPAPHGDAKTLLRGTARHSGAIRRDAGDSRGHRLYSRLLGAEGVPARLVGGGRTYHAARVAAFREEGVASWNTSPSS